MMQKIFWTLIAIGLAALVLALVFGGFTIYQWLLGVEAVIAGIILLVYGLRYWRHDPRSSKWPPLLPLAVIALSGAGKSFYVAADIETPVWLIVILLAAVVWFLVATWWIWRGERKAAK